MKSSLRRSKPLWFRRMKSKVKTFDLLTGWIPSQVGNDARVVCFILGSSRCEHLPATVIRWDRRDPTLLKINTLREQ